MKSGKQDCDQNTTVSSQELEHQLDSCDPLACVLFSQSPSVQVYFALRSRLESCSEPWLQEFVSLDGLECLINSMTLLTSPEMNGFSDAILQIDCLSCIRAVINSKVGMDALITSPSGIEKLLKGVNLANTLPRKLVYEILSVVCVYDKMGYTKLMNALEKLRLENHLYHKYSFVVNELKLAETIPHKKSLLTFINALLSATLDKPQRIRMRSQMIGLGLLDVIAFLRREDSDDELHVQLQLFQDKKHEDEISTNSDANIDLNSPQDLADMIQAQIFGGPKMVCFVNILQDLMAIETTQKEKSNSLWKILEQHVYHMVHSTDDLECLHTVTSHQACSTITEAIDADAKTFRNFYSNPRAVVVPLPKEAPSGLPKEDGVVNKVESCTKKRVSCADSGFIGYEEKPSPQVEKRLKNMQTPESSDFILQTPELVMNSENTAVKRDEDSSPRVCDKPAITSSGSSVNLNKETVCPKQGRKHLSVYDNMSPLESKNSSTDFDTPKLGCFNNLNLKSKELISTDQEDQRNLHLNVLGNDLGKFDSLAEENEGKPTRNPSQSSESSLFQFPASVMRNLKWIKIDESLRDEFPNCVWLKHDVGKLKVQVDYPQVEELFKEPYDWKMAETPLLSTDTRLRLSLFLNRCDKEPTELVKQLTHIEGPAFPLTFIQQLMDTLPEHEEIRHLKFYNGNLLELGLAEQFVLHLSDIPDYTTLLSGQLRRSELYITASRLRSVLTSMLESSRIILSHEGLAEALHLILKAGNFLNHGQFNGYAGGFRLASLARLAEVKSQEAGHSLMHFIVSTVEKKDPRYLSFLSEIPRLKRAASSGLTNIKADFDKMNTQINMFVKQLANVNPIIRNGFNGFLEEVKWKFKELQSLIADLKIQSRRLAGYFCESESFDLQACFQHLLVFFEDLKQCHEELKQMMKEKSNVNKQPTSVFSHPTQFKHLTDRFGQGPGACSSVMEEKRRLVDCVLVAFNQGNYTPILMPLTKRNGDSSDGISEPTSSAPHTPTQEKKQHTPDQEKKSMELSRISLVGTPMMNRPCSEMYDEELTITEKPNFATSSENDLLDGKLIGPPAARPQLPPVLAITGQRTPSHVKGHYRSRSDLADSNIHSKWIRYHDQFKIRQEPVLRPESSIPLATLNLESRGMRRYVHHQNEPVALLPGPTLTLPSSIAVIDSGEKKHERKSALSTFLSRISRRVLKPRNVVEGVDNVGGLADGGGRGVKADGKRTGRMEKNSSKSNSAGKISGSDVVVYGQESQQDKENAGQFAPFQKKSSVRYSNRFKNRIIKT